MATLQLGSSGDAVQAIQATLASQHLYNGKIGGAFGGATLAAVRMFQKKANLEVVGKVGDQTWRIR